MPFVFRLEKVLRHRRRLVDLRGREVAAAAAAVAELTGQITACRNAQRVAAADEPAAGQVVAWQRRAAWIAHLERRVETLGSRRREAEAALANRRAALQQAWRDREVLERLRQRHEAQWRTDQLRRERSELDEIGQQRAHPPARQQKVVPAEEVAARAGTHPFGKGP